MASSANFKKILHLQLPAFVDYADVSGTYVPAPNLHPAISLFALYTGKTTKLLIVDAITAPQRNFVLTVGRAFRAGFVIKKS